MKTMKLKLLLPLIMLGLCINLMAQSNDNKRPHLTKEEYQEKLETFLVQQAGLSSEESKEFFPLYKECQLKKHQLNSKIWDLRKKARNNTLEEKEYQQILEEICNLRIQIDELDKAYLPKYNQILSYKKIFAIQGAEAKFHREMLKNMRKKK